MAVARMKKVSLIAHRHDQPAIVADLQESGFIEIDDVAASDLVTKGAQEELNAYRAGQLRDELSKAQFVLEFFKKAKPAKKGFIAGFMKDRLLIDKARFAGIDKKIDFEDLYLKCEALDSELAKLGREREKLKASASELEDWRGLNFRFDDLRSSEYIGMAVGRVKRNDLAGFEAMLSDSCPETDVAFVADGAQVPGVIVLYYAPDRSDVERALATTAFDYADTKKWSATPIEELVAIDKSLLRVIEDEVRVKDDIAALLPLEDEVMILSDWLQSHRIRYGAQSKFGQTEATFILQGWVEEAKIEELSKRLRSHKAVIDFSFSDPEPHDKVPIVLRNWSVFRPFEVLTRLYGVPNYKELDPTPTMGLFFFLFFGICLGDFGYGVVLILFLLWLKRKLLLTETGRLWAAVFMLGGLSSMISGILTGSYFGLDTKTLPPVLRGLVIIDPLAQAFIFLIATWVIGVIHVLTGLVLEFMDSWKNKKYAVAICENLSLIAVIVSATAALTGWLAGAVFASKEPIYQSLSSGGLTALEITGIAYVLLSGGFIFSKSIGQAMGNLGSGLYNLYGLSSFIGDVLSYSRLMALGLATFLIAFVINTLAGLVVGVTVIGLPVGILLALLIAVPLHIVNLAINLLGAFVHPLRLQFVEFFSKFYENGGAAFHPFAFETDHLIIKEE